MACSTIGKRIAVLIIFPLSLLAGPGLELEVVYDYDKGLSAFISGTYATDRVETKMKINHHKSFPENISLKALPVYKSSNTATENAISTAFATSLTIASDALLYVTKKEIENRTENRKINLYLQRCDDAVKESDPIFEKIEKRLSHG